MKMLSIKFNNFCLEIFKAKADVVKLLEFFRCLVLMFCVGINLDLTDKEKRGESGFLYFSHLCRHLPSIRASWDNSTI